MSEQMLNDGARRQERRLWNFVAGEVIERYEREDEGECGSCREPMNRTVGSSYTPRRDGMRYAPPGDTTGMAAFRCAMCGEVIEDHWRPFPAVPTNEEG